MKKYILLAFIPLLLPFTVYAEMVSPFYYPSSGQRLAAKDGPQYYVWCIYEKKQIRGTTSRRKKAERRAKKHREKWGHGTEVRVVGSGDEIPN